MRLIDADDLKYCHILKAVLDSVGNPMLEEIDINDIPTVFDLDSVVKQIENVVMDAMDKKYKM